MHMLYDSDQFVVVRFDVPAGPATTTSQGAQLSLSRGGYEIVDKRAGREIYIDGSLAEHFTEQVQALIAAGPTQDDVDEFLGGFTVLAQQPVSMH